VEMIELLGHDVIVHMRMGTHSVIGRLRSHSNLPALGETISMQLKTDAMHLFDSVSEQRLR
ncbi:MAG TPA: sn-glycerol-3-phosphate ABC transporter ATP-binding protein UgpC, partial [Gammaproteobacteria bacterium]|nr:sn-glycerol-3-phosphate ABC transporter ATP-binding protein UgpC [Gammaproteobacteria bacterium]